jgi:hypothetical protein
MITYKVLRYMACFGGLTAVVLCVYSAPALAAPLQYKSVREQDRSSMARMEEIASQEVEDELKKWKPTKENDQTPKETIHSRKTDIVGRWKVWRFLDYSTLVIKRLGEDIYEVAFSTGGCLKRWKLKRQGCYVDGVLTLDRPVEEYFPLTYKRLYSVRIGNQDYLVADVAIADFQQSLSTDNKRANRLSELYAYRREDAAIYQSRVIEGLLRGDHLLTGR